MAPIAEIPIYLRIITNQFSYRYKLREVYINFNYLAMVNCMYIKTETQVTIITYSFIVSTTHHFCQLSHLHMELWLLHELHRRNNETAYSMNVVIHFVQLNCNLMYTRRLQNYG